jgi:simple sugar transport system permease protein
MFASGITIFFLYIFTHDKGTSSSVKSLVFPSLQIPIIKEIPILGEIISGHNVLTYFALISVVLFYYLIYKTSLGLRIRAVGQNPDAAEFGSLGGLYLSMGYVSWFSRDMTAGRGFIAIAAAFLGGNSPLGTFFGALFFGIVNAIAIYIAPLNIPSEFIHSLPYFVTVVALAIYSIRLSRKKKMLSKKEEV